MELATDWPQYLHDFLYGFDSPLEVAVGWKYMMIERVVSRLPMHRSESSAVSVDRTKMVMRRLRYDGKPVDVCLCGR